MCKRCFTQKCQLIKNRTLLLVNMLIFAVFVIILIVQSINNTLVFLQGMIITIILFSSFIDSIFDIIFIRIRYNFVFHRKFCWRFFVSLMILLKIVSSSSSMTNFILFLMTNSQIKNLPVPLLWLIFFVQLIMFFLNGLPKTAYLNFRMQGRINHAQQTYTHYFCQHKCDQEYTNFIMQNAKKLQNSLVKSEMEICTRQCCICLEPFKSKEKSSRTSCNHQFHYSCMANWIKKKNNCPVCRNILQ